MNKANHQVNIVRLGEPRVHSNADSLELFDDTAAAEVILARMEPSNANIPVVVGV